MLGELGADNQQLTRFLRATHAVCDEYRNVATASLIENWIDETERRHHPGQCQRARVADHQAPVGESLQLQARVYNYSLADMPAGTTVHVRFYGQAWDNTAHNFIAGSEFVINEVILDNPIPGFRGGQTLTPNWALASTTFDTTNYSDTYLIFWVVVWMEQNGQLVSEMQGHGITAIPGAMTPPTAVAIETYSNNVGFYRQPFFVCPQEACPAPSALTAVAATPVAATAPPLTVERSRSLPPGCRGSRR